MSVIELTLAVPVEDFPTVEQIVALQLAQNPGLTVDDALNEIFLAGLAAMAHRLIPLDPVS